MTRVLAPSHCFWRMWTQASRYGNPWFVACIPSRSLLHDSRFQICGCPTTETVIVHRYDTTCITDTSPIHELSDLAILYRTSSGTATTALWSGACSSYYVWSETGILETLLAVGRCLLSFGLNQLSPYHQQPDIWVGSLSDAYIVEWEAKCRSKWRTT